MLNRIILIGRLVADPQLRYTQQGTGVANFRIAVDRPYSNQQGERETDFIDIVCWRKLADIVATNLKKGRLVAVDGRLQIRNYEWEGQKRQSAEVQAEDVRFLDRPQGSGNQGMAGTAGGYSGGSEGGYSSGSNSGPQGGYAGGFAGGSTDPGPDDVPF